MWSIMLRKLVILLLAHLCSASDGTSLPNICGHSLNKDSEVLYIVGGTDAAVGEFPWQILLTTIGLNDPEDLNICGGVIINERWVLTAGHCITFMPKNTTFNVRLGVHNESLREETEIVSYAEKIIVHQNFTIINNTETKRIDVWNDLTLIKLNVTLDFKSNSSLVRPICLARTNTKLTNKCVATGWGITEPDGKRPANGILKKLEMPLLNPEVCKNASATSLNGINFNETIHVCAGLSDGKTVCDHDSGGPLQCLGSDGFWYEVGVTDFGFSYYCGEDHKPNAFTKVSAFIDWIENTISRN